MAGSQRTTRRVWAAISMVLTCLTVAACDHSQEHDRLSTVTGPSKIVTIRGAVHDVSGTPLAGADLVGTAGKQSTAVTDRDGRFDLGSFDATYGSVRVDITKSGFLSRTVFVPTSSGEIDQLFELWPTAPLPLDSSITLDLLPSDPAQWLGVTYASEFSWNTRYYAFPALNTEVVVDLDWDHAAAPQLKLWIVDDVLSQASGTHEVLTLTRGRSGFLMVANTGGAALTRPVTFTLTVR
jgi:hypothetical protein